MLKLPRRKFLRLAAGAAALPAMPYIARAQVYPTRPVTLIVPFAAAGPTDVAARIIGEHMSRTLGQRLVVENVVGAGGTTGSLRAMRATPDGYTIQMGHMGTHAIAVSLYPNLGYEPDADFEPIGVVVNQPLVIITRKGLADIAIQSRWNTGRRMDGHSCRKLQCRRHSTAASCCLHRQH